MSETTMITYAAFMAATEQLVSKHMGGAWNRIDRLERELSTALRRAEEAEAIANLAMSAGRAAFMAERILTELVAEERDEWEQRARAEWRRAEDAESIANLAMSEGLKAVEERTPPDIHFHVAPDVFFAVVPMARIVARLGDGESELTICGEDGPIAHVVVRPVRGAPLESETFSIAAALYWSWWRWKTGVKAAEVTAQKADDDEMTALANELADIVAEYRKHSSETIKAAIAQSKGASDA